jgi:hypothetical protein
VSILSPFSCIRIISEYFRRERNITVERNLLNMYANGDINGALTFISLIVIPSYPQADFGFVDLIISSIALLLNFFNTNFKMVLKMRYIDNPWAAYLFLHPYLSAHL